MDVPSIYLTTYIHRGERAYRPDDDLVSAACSNIAEILGAKGDSYEEEAVGYAERAVRLTDKVRGGKGRGRAPFLVLPHSLALSDRYHSTHIHLHRWRSLV